MTDRPSAALAGLRVVVTRASDAGPALADALAAAGADVRSHAATHITRLDPAPLDAGLATLAGGDWLVCTSANGVRAVVDRLAALAHPLPDGVRVAAVGTTTAQAFLAAGIAVTLVPERHDAEGLVEAFAARGHVDGARVLFAAAAGARPVLADGLTALGAIVTVVPCYVSEPDAAGLAALAADVATGTVDLITLAAPSAAEAVASALPAPRPPVAVIGPVTARAARALGFDVRVEAPDATVPALVQAIVDAVQAGRVLAPAAPPQRGHAA